MPELQYTTDRADRTGPGNASETGVLPNAFPQRVTRYAARSGPRRAHSRKKTLNQPTPNETGNA